jgi:hypothetical protein
VVAGLREEAPGEVTDAHGRNDGNHGSYASRCALRGPVRAPRAG